MESSDHLYSLSTVTYTNRRKPPVTSTNANRQDQDPNRRVLMFFSGSARELRSWLASLTLLTCDESYEWELSASVSRHPAGKALKPPICGRPSSGDRVCVLDFDHLGVHDYREPWAVQ
jgi:hypothetical protein